MSDKLPNGRDRKADRRTAKRIRRLEREPVADLNRTISLDHKLVPLVSRSTSPMTMPRLSGCVRVTYSRPSRPPYMPPVKPRL